VWNLPDVFEGVEPIMRLMRAQGASLVLQCPDGALRSLAPTQDGDEEAGAGTGIVFDSVIGVSQSNGRMVVGAMPSGEPLTLYALDPIDGTRTQYTMPASPPGHRPRLFFGHGGWQGPDNVELVAAEYTPGVWRVVQGRHRVDLEVSPDVSVVGVTRNTRFGAEPCLVVDDGRRLTLEGLRDTWPLPRVGSTIVGATCNHANAQVAWLTDRGRLVVFSLEHEKVVFNTDLRSLQVISHAPPTEQAL
jgi:hypothetical protein